MGIERVWQILSYAFPMAIKHTILKALLIVLMLALIPVSAISAQKITPGATCKSVNQKSVYMNKTYTCIKSGKKLVWNKGVVVKKPTPKPTPTAIGDPEGAIGGTPSPTPTPTPTAEPIVLPTSFENLYERRKGISLAAWQKSSDVIKASKNKSGPLEIFTGPNTKPNFDDYPTPVSLVSRLFPARTEPAKTIVIRYKYVDLEWAETTLRSKLTAEEFTQLNNNEGGKAIAGRCDVSSRNCRGAMQQTTMAGLSLIIQGVPNEEDKNDPTGKLRFGSGMLEAHEYFHSLQRIPIMDKTNVWPHAWFREGGAEWVQNMAVNYNDYKTYQDFIVADCSYSCTKLSEADIVEFLENSKENYTPPKFDQFLNYSLSSRFIEALVALKGPDIVIDIYEQMGKRLTFEQGFKNTFGVEWSYALPILAKTIYANLKG